MFDKLFCIFRYPSVKRLGVHLEKQQSVLMMENVPLPKALEKTEKSELLAFFQYNMEHPECVIMCYAAFY